jgi:nucleotide-binding universal stress UspA family protein
MTSPPPWRCISVGYDGSPAARAALRLAELLAEPPAGAIARVAEARHADAIIVGTRGFGRARAVLGSVSHELLHLAPCPVTVMPERVAAPPERPVSVPAAAGAA